MIFKSKFLLFFFFIIFTFCFSNFISQTLAHQKPYCKKDKHGHYEIQLNKQPLNKAVAQTKPTSAGIPTEQILYKKKNKCPKKVKRKKTQTVTQYNVPAPSPTQIGKFEGFYVGTQAGAYAASAELQGMSGHFGTSDAGSQPIKTKLSATVPTIVPYFGYGWQFSEFYLGLEASYQIMSAVTKAINNQSSYDKVLYRLKHKHRMTGWVRMGYVYDQMLFYVKAGITRGYFTAVADYYEIRNQMLPNEDPKIVKKHRHALAGAFGIDFLTSKKITFGAEVEYARFNNIQFTQHSIAGVYATTTFKPEAIGVYARIGYKF